MFSTVTLYIWTLDVGRGTYSASYHIYNTYHKSPNRPNLPHAPYLPPSKPCVALAARVS